MAAPAGGLTTVTEYRYNADGALTARITQVGEASPTTTYLTWDNFVPEAADPTTGTVSAGNGRLLGSGPAPGTENASRSLVFDSRDRLTAYRGADATQSYGYHAAGMMSSASSNGDTLSFYYDGRDNPQITNAHQSDTELWSAYLDGVRYLDDGSEQALLKPRKDVACTYDTGTETILAYSYEAYGASPDDTSSSTSYDLRDNPFRFAGEYRDPLSGLYFLRARWYDPDLQTFISRDSMPHMNRFGYGGGNPVMRIDPSGRSFSWSRDIGKPFSSFLTGINKGVGGHFARVFLTPVLGPLQILANPKAFWESIVHDKNGAAIFLTLSVVAAQAFLVFGAELEPAFYGEVFAARALTAVGLGTGQSTANAASRGFRHFNWNTFLDGEEGAIGATVEASLFAGKGYNRFNQSGEDVAALIGKLDKSEPDTVLVVRQRTNLRVGPTGRTLPVPMQTGPLQESMGLGLYHEQILAISREDIFTTSLEDGIVEQAAERGVGTKGIQQYFRKFRSKDFEVIGIKTNFDRTQGFEDVGTAGFWTGRDHFLKSDIERNPSRIFANNCQHHAAAVLRQLGF